MGYACPVCDIEQPDGEHLAHHLAFTAMLHGDDHESWLDEHAPGWGDFGPAELADVVVRDAPEVDVQGAESADSHGGRTHGHGHGHGNGHGHGHTTPEYGGRTASRGGRDGLDADAAAVLQEAQALTQSMLEADEGNDEDENDDDGDATDDAVTDDDR